MAIFKVGQRVRRIANYVSNVPIGSTGTVTGFWENLCSKTPQDVCVKWDGTTSNFGCVAYAPWTLAPLTDPSADAFIASIKAMKPYEEPKVGKKEGVKHG